MKSYLLLLFSIIFTLTCSSCDDDDDNEDKNITPHGIVILNPQILIDNESNCEIIFRVNPSNYEVSPGSIALDCVQSNTIGRGVSVTPPENFELVSVQALVDEEEKIHEGEWVATVKVKDGLPFAELTRIFLVLNYNIEKNQVVSITSSNYAEITTIPAISEKMVSFSNPTVQSYKSPVNGEVLSSRIHVTPNPLNETTNINYDLSLIQNMEVVLKGEFADYFQVSKMQDDYGLAFDITPILSNFDAYFNEHTDINSIPTTAEVTLTDIFGNTLVHNVDVSFFRNIQIIPVTEGLTYNRADFEGPDLVPEVIVDMSEYLPKIGITQEFLAEHPNRAFSIVCTGYMPDGQEGNYGFGFAGHSITDDETSMKTGKFQATLDVLFDPEHSLSGSYYAVIRFFIVDPITRDTIICADIRQEIKLVD